ATPGITSATISVLARVSPGRRRPGRILRRAAPALFRPHPLERRGPHPQGTPVRFDEQRRRGRKGVLLLGPYGGWTMKRVLQGLLVLVPSALLAIAAHAQKPSPGEPMDSPDARAAATEQQMTDDERFGMIISIMGHAPISVLPPDPRVKDIENQSAGYTPGIPRLGIPALQSSDASMGVTNPGYRPDDKGATAFPASIVV